jgi:hypothetical protein
LGDLILEGHFQAILKKIRCEAILTFGGSNERYEQGESTIDDKNFFEDTQAAIFPK